MVKNILIFTIACLIAFIGISNAQEKQCWRGTVEVVSVTQLEENKKKELPSGHGVDIFKHNKNIRLKIDFYIEPGKKDVILGKEISGSYSYELKEKWQSKYATCRKRVEPGKMKRDVHVSPGGSHYKEIISTAALYEDNFEFDMDISMDTNPKSKTYRIYYLDLHISGLQWKGNHRDIRKFKRVDRWTCKAESSEDPPVSEDFAKKASRFGGRYKGYAVTDNTIIGSKTTKGPTGELWPDNKYSEELEKKIWGTGPYTTTYSWELHRVVCDPCKVIKLECEKKAAEDLETCELAVCGACNLLKSLSEIKECMDKCHNDCVKTYGGDLAECTNSYNTCRKTID